MKEEIIKKYFESLSNGDYKSLIQLFDSEAIVFSPLYGKRLAKDFYKELIEDSDENSKVDLITAFVKGSKGAGHFEYSWILKNKKKSSFEGVDLFEFNEEGKIKQIKIIYDTFRTRENFNKMTSSAD